MVANQLTKIYPCPLSKGYGIPVEQAWSLLKIFFIYRIVVSSLFVSLYHSHTGPSLLGEHDALLYSYTSIIYWLLSIVTGVTIFRRLIDYASQSQLVIFTDIICVTLIMHASGGIHSGIGILLVVSIAAGGMLIGGRCAILFAALASLAILTEQVYALQTHAFRQTSFTYAGMLGASFFTIAYLSYVLAKRTEQSELLANQHQQTISNLEELNQYIIQHLQSGIIISNSSQQIRMCNQAAVTIIGKNEETISAQYLTQISPQLSEAFQLWLNDSSQDFALIQLPNQNEVQLRFSLLNTSHETFHMIIMDDSMHYNQQLQQGKLASLGRLSASIAHEIRNPLGAISHAGQLLSEAPTLSPQDQRLTEIIQSHCHRMNKIIEDILQLSRRNPSHKEKINLALWLPIYLDNFINHQACPSNSFEIFKKTENTLVCIDPQHLKQILDNLCTNALKYGDANTQKITLEINQTDNSPCIQVLNNGKKIDQETIAHLFEPFFTTSSSGTGLGLYISKELAELNHAKLSYAITENDKSSFRLCFPSSDKSIIEI